MGYFIKRTGALTYNTTTNAMEYNNGVQTVEVAKVGGVPPVIDTFTTVGTTVTFTMTVDYGVGGDYDYDANNPANVLVFLDGIYQAPTTSYTVSNTDVTFTAIPPVGLTISVVHGLYSTNVPYGSEF